MRTNLMWITVFAWFLLVLGALVQRYGLASFKLPLAMMAVAVLLLLVASLMHTVSYWKTRQIVSLGYLLLAFSPVLVACLILGPKVGMPPIHDVSTKPGELDFVSASADRKAGDNSLEQPSEKVIAQQKQAYPDLKTIELKGITLDEAFRKARAASEALGWEVFYEQAPYRIEARATTQLMRFVDDVLVSLEQRPDSIAVDIRSASRVGLGDLGANAARIRAFRQKLLGLVDQS